MNDNDDTDVKCQPAAGLEIKDGRWYQGILGRKSRSRIQGRSPGRVGIIGVFEVFDHWLACCNAYRAFPLKVKTRHFQELVVIYFNLAKCWVSIR